MTCHHPGCGNEVKTTDDGRSKRRRYCDDPACRRERDNAACRANYAKTRRKNHNRQSPVNLLGSAGFDYAAAVERDLRQLHESIAPCMEMEEFRARLKSPRGQGFLERVACGR